MSADDPSRRSGQGIDLHKLAELGALLGRYRAEGAAPTEAVALPTGPTDRELVEGFGGMWCGESEGTLDAPAFDRARTVHDWRNHVPEEIRVRWPALSRETRAAVYAMASFAASAEEWD